MSASLCCDCYGEKCSEGRYDIFWVLCDTICRRSRRNIDGEREMIQSLILPMTYMAVSKWREKDFVGPLITSKILVINCFFRILYFSLYITIS